jgi:flagellar biosynthetic protein FliR
MEFDQAELTAWIGSYLWTFCRIGAALAIAPVISMQIVPVRVRLVLAIALTLVIAPLVPPVPQIDPLSLAGIMVVVQQILIGTAIGLVLMMVIGIFVHAGQIVAMQIGLGFASMIDPANGVPIPMVGQFYVITVTLLYLAMDGHLMLIEMLANSFTILPISTSGIGTIGIRDLVYHGSAIFSGGMQVALPAIAILLFVNMAFGVLSRSVPQLNIFSVGFPISMLFGFLALLYSLPQLVTHVEVMFGRAYEFIYAILRTGAI